LAKGPVGDASHRRHKHSIGQDIRSDLHGERG
jgi:hypothetical protein